MMHPKKRRLIHSNSTTMLRHVGSVTTMFGSVFKPNRHRILSYFCRLQAGNDLDDHHSVRLGTSLLAADENQREERRQLPLGRSGNAYGRSLIRQRSYLLSFMNDPKPLCGVVWP